MSRTLKDSKKAVWKFPYSFVLNRTKQDIWVPKYRLLGEPKTHYNHFIYSVNKNLSL